MKKSINILLALVIAFFTLQFGGITALADEKVYDDIEDEEYEIDIKLLKKGTDEKSAAADFMNENATLTIENGKAKLTFYIPNNPMMDFNKFELEGLKPTFKDVDDLSYYTFELNELKTSLSAIVSYEVPGIIKHDDVSMDIELVGLDELPKKEEVKPEDPEQPGNENDDEKEELEVAPEERKTGKLLTEKEADAVYQLNYETDSRATSGQLKNPVKLLEKGNGKYVQIEVNERGAPLFRSLTFNGKEVTWNSITEGPYTIQFELPNGIEDELDVSMVIQAGPNAMPHDNIKLWFDEDSLETIKEPEAKPEKVEIEQGAKTPVKSNDIIIVKDSENTKITMPDGLPEDVKVTITSKEQIENQGDLEAVGDVLEFDFEGIDDFSGTFELVMSYDADKYDTNQVGIYYYDEENSKWLLQDGKVENGLITVEVEHFSTYGVFAKAAESDEQEDNDENGSNGDKDENEELTPDKTEVNYVVKHATEDETSAADSFFTKPADLIERDGETYIQLTITSWSMIDWLRTDQGDVDIIKVNDDDSVVVEFKVTGDLSDAINLTMQVTVPGLYEKEHEARLFLEVDEGEEPVEDPVVPTPTPDPTPTPNPEPKPKEKSEQVPKKAFEIDYVVKHATEDSISAADSFFEKPAFLLYGENGEQYIQLTINSWDMIDWLRTEHGGDVIVVKENDDGSALIQFKVTGDLSDAINLSMHITVPGLYSMEHDARIFLDIDSQKEVDVSDFKIVVDKKGSTLDPTDPKGPGKPEFGNGEDNGKNGEDTVKPAKNDNPQTGDTTSIFLYAMLLIGSLIPLAVKLRRRFV